MSSSPRATVNTVAESVLSLAELWMLYDQVASVLERLERAADEAMVDTGARPWRELRDKLRGQITEVEREVGRGEMAEAINR